MSQAYASVINASAKLLPTSTSGSIVPATTARANSDWGEIGGTAMSGAGQAVWDATVG